MKQKKNNLLSGLNQWEEILFSQMYGFNPLAFFTRTQTVKADGSQMDLSAVKLFCSGGKF